MTPLCLAPVLLIGHLFTLHPNPSHTSRLDGTMIEVQTCDRGIGLDVKATDSGLYGLNAQYGFQWRDGPFSVTLTPQAGGAYHDVQRPEETSKLTFGLGGQLSLGYGSARVAVEYWHNSNAGLGHQNAGFDMIGILGGWSFE